MVLKIVLGLLLTLAVGTSATKLNKEIENEEKQELARSPPEPIADREQSEPEGEGEDKVESEDTEEKEDETTEEPNETEIGEVMETEGSMHAITKRAIRIKGFGKLLNRFTIKCEKNKKCSKFCNKHYKHAIGKCMRLKTRISFPFRAHFVNRTRKFCGCKRRHHD